MAGKQEKPVAADITQMPGTLREFSQWLSWMKAGKPTKAPLTGPDHPAGELFDALVAEGAAKQMVKALDRDKGVAVQWLSAYAAVGINSDTSVTTEHQFATRPGQVRPARVKVNGEKLKTHYPALWAQCRVYKPYRSVALSKDVAPSEVRFDPTLPVPPAELPPEPREWPVTWGAAYNTHQARLDEAKGYKKVIDDAVAVMAEMLLDESGSETVPAVRKFWDGHGVAEFADGTKIQFDRLQFDAGVAEELIDDVDALVDTSKFLEFVEEKQDKPTRYVGRMGHEGAVEGEAELVADPNPFEGD